MNNHIYSTLFKIQERKSDRRSREIEQRKSLSWPWALMEEVWGLVCKMSNDRANPFGQIHTKISTLDKYRYGKYYQMPVYRARRLIPPYLAPLVPGRGVVGHYIDRCIMHSMHTLQLTHSLVFPKVQKLVSGRDVDVRGSRSFYPGFGYIQIDIYVLIAAVIAKTLSIIIVLVANFC